MVTFDAGAAGRIEITLRPPAAVLDFLGALVRAQRAGAPGDPGSVLRGLDGRPLFVVVEEPPPEAPAIAAVELQGVRHAIPAGPEGGYSGEVFSFMAQLVGQAQSVRDLPASNAVTIVGD